MITDEHRLLKYSGHGELWTSGRSLTRRLLTPTITSSFRASVFIMIVGNLDVLPLSLPLAGEGDTRASLFPLRWPLSCSRRSFQIQHGCTGTFGSAQKPTDSCHTLACQNVISTINTSSVHSGRTQRCRL